MDREALEGDFRRYQDAVLTLHGWASGARGLALLRGALASGVLDAVRTPRTIGEISAATGIGDPPGSAEDLREPAGRSYAVDRLVYGSWGVPCAASRD